MGGGRLFILDRCQSIFAPQTAINKTITPKLQHKQRDENELKAAALNLSVASHHACSRTDATLFWTCIKIAKALKDWIWDEIEIRGRSTACRQCLGGV